jgi:hypothetical protein
VTAQSGANALAPQHLQAPPAERPPATTVLERANTSQASLFSEAPAPNVIPFGRMRRSISGAPEPLNDLSEPTLEMPRPVAPREAARRPKTQPAVDNLQTALNFHSAGTQSARMLKTTVEAVIYCDAPVAAPLHRALAAALDAGLIVVGCTAFAVLFHYLGGPVQWSKLTIGIFVALFGLIAIFYGLMWAIAGRESAGMRALQLKLINFDGFPPDGRSRGMRLCGTALSFCSGGLGIFWALVDEESLGWQDHISRTFPTVDEGRSFLRTAPNNYADTRE